MKLQNYIDKKKTNYIKITSFFAITLITIISFFDFNNFVNSLLRLNSFFSKLYPMDLYFVSAIYEPILNTILIALLSTILGVATTLLLLPLQNNLLYENKTIPKITSAIFSIFRTIPSLIIASILVSVFSVGNFSGFLCLYIISILISSKILKEYSEEINKKHIDSLVSLGFGRFKIYKVGIFENLKPNILSVFFLVLESNIRGASILGLVGAGGIGQLLWKELNHLRYDRVSLIILILILIIVLIDLISYLFRSKKFNFVNKNNYYRRNIQINFIFLLILFISIYLSTNYLNIGLDRIKIGLVNLKNMLFGLLQPDFSYLIKALRALLDSFIVAFSSTALAATTTVLITYFYVARLSNIFSSLIFKIIINIFRTIPPIIVAIIFFRGFGPGYLSSFFALYFYTVGIMTKMFGEVLENIDNNIFLSIKSMGISKFSGYKNIILKGCFPEFLSIYLYRFEMNIKNSTILGMVGAGGIGQLLINNIEFRNWNKTSTILIVLCLSIIIVENLSNIIRERIKT
ncbi:MULTISPECIES: ABC transporter permease [unclassified Gemella]|uniref:PhnE/PtxC family ABC transporter permease n=1 Tax=unclassified Gemella TaxID=2624949 RepID=UPI001C05E42B|nr:MULTISPECIES: ABC transporter permease subunit [unclassified Gemella]MBU0278482.1 ABC transporter permease subunit [Gemella sp. zg-1178]QWQ39477.1 ABC transporter permease subunit [Gemella sp. zg-570]